MSSSRSRHGPLPYRSLRFDRRSEEAAAGLPVGTVNYPNEFDFTRITDQRHLSGKLDADPILTTEYPEQYTPGVNEPYYPTNETNAALMQSYLRDAQEVSGKGHVCGPFGGLRLLQHGSGLWAGTLCIREANRPACCRLPELICRYDGYPPFVARLDELIGPQCPATFVAIRPLIKETPCAALIVHELRDQKAI